MNTPKHTPGPICTCGVITTVIETGIGCYGENEIAQCPLCKAAPAMYEALKAIQEKISGADVLFDPNPQWEGDQARYDAAQEALFSVDQALAQAEGK